MMEQCTVVGLLKAQGSLQLGKIFSPDNGSFSFYNELIHVLTFTAAYSQEKALSDTVLSLNMYEYFMNTKYLCACFKRYHANLTLQQG